MTSVLPHGFPRRLGLLAAVFTLAATTVTACGQSSRLPPPEVANGNPNRGAKLIATYGCGSCHQIPGVPGADGLVGPPLGTIGKRSYIAGVLPNTGDNLQRWIQHPQQFVPGNAMPDLGIGDQDARDIAAYLYSLQ